MDATCDNKNGYQQQINAIKTGVYSTVVIHLDCYQEVSLAKMANTQQSYVKIVERKVRDGMMRIIEG
jgi:hypothetical protein